MSKQLLITLVTVNCIRMGPPPPPNQGSRPRSKSFVKPKIIQTEVMAPFEPMMNDFDMWNNEPIPEPKKEEPEIKVK